MSVEVITSPTEVRVSPLAVCVIGLMTVAAIYAATRIAKK